MTGIQQGCTNVLTVKIATTTIREIQLWEMAICRGKCPYHMIRSLQLAISISNALRVVPRLVANSDVDY